MTSNSEVIKKFIKNHLINTNKILLKLTEVHCSAHEEYKYLGLEQILH